MDPQISLFGYQIPNYLLGIKYHVIRHLFNPLNERMIVTVSQYITTTSPKVHNFVVHKVVNFRKKREYGVHCQTSCH